MAEPEKFFVGIIDFFSVLLPGVLLTYLLKYELRRIDQHYAMVDGTQGWVVFLVISYLLGHFIFLLGSWLDDHVYDPIRKATYDAQLKQLAKGGELSQYLPRLLASFFFKKGADRAVTRAVALRDQYLKPVQATSAVNAFQWCKARLTLEHPQALADVQNFEAHSKFFRSLVVVLCIVVVGALVTAVPRVEGRLVHIFEPQAPGPPDAHVKNVSFAIICAVLLPLAFWRYVEQRAKATNQAYWYVIAMEGQRENQGQKPSAATDFTHAGGVVFRRVKEDEKERIEYLLVQAKLKPEEWVLPKGRIETDEPMCETAVREVREETGVWAQIQGELDGIPLTVKNKPVKVQFYLMEYLEEEEPSVNDKEREHLWLGLEDALQKASHNETLGLLRLAELKRRSPDSTGTTA